MSTNALKKHLDSIRKLAHQVQMKNGHYKKMVVAKRAKLSKTNA